MSSIFNGKRKKSKSSKKTSSKSIFSFKKMNSTRLAINLVVLFCVILVGFSGWLWWTKIFMNPDRVLGDTISNGLKTRSITKHVNQTGQNGGVDQVSYLSFYPPAASSQTVTVLTQGSGSNTASITTETIGINDADFVKYSEIKGADGLIASDKLNSLLGVWAKREQNSSTGAQTTFLNETIFGVVPIGNLNPEQKNQLEELINQKNIYTYSNAEKKIENKRPVYVYEMSINPADLVSIIQEYVKLTGIGDPAQLDPSQYQGASAIQIKFTIDIISRQLVKVEYPTGRTETYSGQNLYRPTQIPNETIPIDELEKRLQGA